MRSVSSFKRISAAAGVIVGLLTTTAAIAQAPPPPELPLSGFSCNNGQINFGFINPAPFPGIGNGNLFAFMEVPATSGRNPNQVGFYVPNLNVSNFTGARFLWSSQSGPDTPTPNAPDYLTARFCFRSKKNGKPILEEIPLRNWKNNPFGNNDFDSSVGLSKFSDPLVRSGQAVLKNVTLFVNSASFDQFVLGGEFLILTKTGSIEPDDALPGNIGCKGAKLCGLANLELLRNRVRQQR
jgi:hypothetical protein